MAEVAVAMDEAVFLPNGALNALRREALAALQNALLEPYWRTKTDSQPILENSLQYEKQQQKPRIITLTERRELLPVLLERAKVTTVYLDFAAYDRERLAEQLAADVAACRETGKEVYFALPRIFRADMSVYFTKMMAMLDNIAPDGFLVRTYEELSFVRTHFPGCPFVCDHCLYTYNDEAVAAFAALGAERDTVPVELNKSEIRRRDNRASEMVIYGYYPLMTSAQCVHANTEGCDRRPGLTFLEDRYHVHFPVKNVCGACYNVIYNSLPVQLFAQREQLAADGVRSYRLDFTVETPDEAREVLAFLDADASGWQKPYTNGHYKRGVE
jgi:putative protease